MGAGAARRRGKVLTSAMSLGAKTPTYEGKEGYALPKVPRGGNASNLSQGGFSK